MQGNRKVDLIFIVIQDIQPFSVCDIVLYFWDSIFSVNELIGIIAIDERFWDVYSKAIKVLLCFCAFLPLNDVFVET